MPSETAPQVVAVTGGQGSLGKATAESFARLGAKIHAPGHQQLDICDPAAVARYFAALPRLDLLVANAGIAQDAPVARMSPTSWETVLTTNLTGTFRCARAAAKIMVRQRTGHIIFIGSRSGITGPAGQANYAAAKAGLTGLTKSLAAELGPRNIRVNCVLPGFLETPFTQRITEKRRAEILAEHTLGTPNTPAAAASFINYLHTSMPHTSGQIISLDSRINP